MALGPHLFNQRVLQLEHTTYEWVSSNIGYPHQGPQLEFCGASLLCAGNSWKAKKWATMQCEGRGVVWCCVDKNAYSKGSGEIVD